MSSSNVWRVAAVSASSVFFPIPGRYGLFFLAGFSRALLDKLCGSLSEGLEGGAGHLLHPAGQLELGAGGVCLQKVGEQGPELVLASKLFIMLSILYILY